MLQSAQTGLKFAYKLIFGLMLVVSFLCRLQLFGDLENFQFQFFDFIALEIDKLEHLKIFLLIFSENSQELFEVGYLCGSLYLSKILPKFLDFIHLLRVFLGLPEL